jgi:hypothetical protein
MICPELLQGQNQTLKRGNIDGISQKRLQNALDRVLYGCNEKAAIIQKSPLDSE